MPFDVQEKRQEAAEMKKESRSAGKGEEVDVDEDKHEGQIALRKLYHQSPRPILVLYSAKTCGPCRTLKPILNAVADEYQSKVSPSLPLGLALRLAL